MALRVQLDQSSGHLSHSGDEWRKTSETDSSVEIGEVRLRLNSSVPAIGVQSAVEIKTNRDCNIQLHGKSIEILEQWCVESPLDQT